MKKESPVSDTHQWGPATDPVALRRHEIELRMLAVRDHVPGLRALLGDRAMRADHDLDFIEDVRLAVDEVCAIMLANCTPEDVLTVRLLVEVRCVEISARVRATADPVVSGLSLRVLQALADSLDYWVEDTADGRVFRLDFGRARPSATASY
jgi:serine/threonine-protein kinase RsbW